MPKTIEERLNEVTDEATFVRFLSSLREECEASQHDCERGYDDCAPADHWQTRSTSNYLKSMEQWAGGDFVEGAHYGEPILRRIATMLWVGKSLRSDDRPR